MLDGGINVKFGDSNLFVIPRKVSMKYMFLQMVKTISSSIVELRFDSSEQEEISEDRVLSPITGKLLDSKASKGSSVSKGDVV